ncbi:MAG: hypothetical protein ABIQ75_08980 [Flavobacteriales bacterium]
MAETSSTSSSKRTAVRFLLSTAVGIAVGCLLLDWPLTRLALANENFGAFKVHRMFTEDHPGEVAIIGSSRAAGAYIPSLLGDPVFNYGIEETGWREARLMLTKELSKPKSTPVIVNFEYSFFDGHKPNTAHFIPTADQSEVRSFLSKRMRWYYRFPTLRYFGTVDEYVRVFIPLLIRKGQVSDNGFFIDNGPDRATRDKMLAIGISRLPSRWNPHPAEEKAFLELLGSTQRTIVLAIAPYYPQFYKDFSHMDQAEAWLASARSLPNVVVVDLGRMPLPEADYLNVTHVMLPGAEAFSKELRKELSARGIEL